jgi:DHA1 family bicyclomycin/chloramphenicol resistance-like MFS transporter
MKKNRAEKQMITILLIALATVANLSISVYTPSMPSLVQYFHSTASTVQFTYTGFLIGIAIGPLVYGPLSDHFGRRPVIMTGLVFYLLANIACVFSTSIEMLIAARIIQALAISATGVGTAVVRDLFGGRLAAKILAYLAVASTLAPAVGPLLGGQIHHYFDWHGVFVFLAIIGAILLVLCWLKLPETNPWRAPRPWHYRDMFQGFNALLRTPIFLAYSLNGAFILAVIYAYNSAAPFIFIGHLGATPETYGLYTIYPTISFALGSYLGAKLVPRLGLQQSIWTGTIISLIGCVGFAAFVFAGYMTILSILIPYCLFLIGAGINLPSSMAGCLNRYPKLAGTSSSFATFLRMSIAVLVSVGANVETSHGAVALGWIFPSLGLLAVLANLALLRFAKQETGLQLASQTGELK